MAQAKKNKKEKATKGEMVQVVMKATNRGKPRLERYKPHKAQKYINEKWVLMMVDKRHLSKWLHTVNEYNALVADMKRFYEDCLVGRSNVGQVAKGRR